MLKKENFKLWKKEIDKGHEDYWYETDKEANEYLTNKCGVFNKEDNISDDDCDNCEYCYSQGNFGEQKEAFQMSLQALEKQIPKKPYKDNENGIYEKEYCPICHRSLFPNDHHCICGQAIDWRDEE